MSRRFRWRDYRTQNGAQPVTVFIRSLTDEDAAAVLEAMNDVAQNGLQAARHLRGEIYEVRADGERRTFRLLFAQETKFILLSLSAFTKKSRKTPPDEIVRAEARLRDWRSRGRPLRR
ncbi:MAG TPA: type II toxin-antitoxin system RelE/ParE family toxin [Opitutaceae bacterium]|nr:type II toxin-antitoxin system RelE/ParE family toxin [Polyangia bacterium]HWA10256.1 type II toxin-antitoxin system RelE/ParE family toxin [Opitutaceae bacterium]